MFFKNKNSQTTPTLTSSTTSPKDFFLDFLQSKTTPQARKRGRSVAALGELLTSEGCPTEAKGSRREAKMKEKQEKAQMPLPGKAKERRGGLQRKPKRKKYGLAVIHVGSGFMHNALDSEFICNTCS